MITAALIVGFVTAWAYGPRAGLTAAGVALGLFLVALFVPPFRLYIYGGVALGVAAIAAIAARRPRHPAVGRAIDMGRALYRAMRK